MADMADMLKNFASMMNGKDVPDNVKEMFSSMMNNEKNKDEQSSEKAGSTISNSNSVPGNGSGDASEMPNIDIDTILKMQKIMSSLNSTKNSSGANLLRALKPYLRPNRQAKVDEYINLLGIEKVIDLMNNQNSNKK